MTTNLSSFFNHFSTVADPQVIPLWRYDEFDTKYGTRRELHFVGQAALLTETAEDRLEFVAIQTQEFRVYKHAGYMLALLAEFYLDERPSVDIKLYGQAFQAFMTVNNVNVEPITADGTVEHRDRFGNLSEKQVSKITAVHLTRIQKEHK